MSDLILFMQRDVSREDEMLGDLWLNYEDAAQSVIPFCHTLEDEYREIKVPGETAIPAGMYEILKRPLGDSRMDEKYIARYPFFDGQLWLQNVFNFKWVYIHTGNNDEHTDGCILVGKNKYVDAIGASRQAYRKLYPIVNAAINDVTRKAYIDIRDAA